MIGSLITKKCTKALITAPISQINGGKAMTPGLSDAVSELITFAKYAVQC